MNHPADLDRTADHDTEDRVVAHHEEPISSKSKPCIPGLPARPRKPREASDRPLDPAHERPSRARVVPGDVIEDVEQVLFSGGKILEVGRPAHGTRARSLRIISRCAIPLAPFAAWTSASSSFRYSSSCACKRS